MSELTGVPIVLVVPEVNLQDWFRDRPVAWLKGTASRHWHQLHERAFALIAKGDYDALVQCASDMLELDRGSSPTSYRLRALGWRHVGQQHTATHLRNRGASTRSNSDIGRLTAHPCCQYRIPQRGSEQ